MNNEHKGSGWHMLLRILLYIGGVNWGLVGLGMVFGGNIVSWNVVHLILGGAPMLEAIVYLLVGIAAVIKVFGGGCKHHKTETSPKENVSG